MTDVIANVLEREVGIDESLHAAMSERVRSRARYFDAGLANVERRASGDSRRSNRLVWRQSAEEHMPIDRRRARVLQVIDERCTHGGRQWVSCRIAGLALPYFNAVIAPIDVIELKRGDFAGA